MEYFLYITIMYCTFAADIVVFMQHKPNDTK